MPYKNREDAIACYRRRAHVYEARRRERYYRETEAQRGPCRAIAFEKRFWLKVWPRGDCWEWRGACDRDGYGQCNRDGRQYKAHRLAYEMAKGQFLQTMEIHHICNHRWCVKPSHLLVVTTQENVLASEHVSARNARKTHCKHGHPFDAENTYYSTDGCRHCRECGRRATREWMKKSAKSPRKPENVCTLAQYAQSPRWDGYRLF